jgi:hypothetical protein
MRYITLLDRALKADPTNEHFLSLQEGLFDELTYSAEMGTIIPPTDPSSAPTQPATAVAEIGTETPTPVVVIPSPVTGTPVPSAPGFMLPGLLVIIVVVALGAVLIAVVLGIGIWLGRRSKRDN